MKKATTTLISLLITPLTAFAEGQNSTCEHPTVSQEIYSCSLSRLAITDQKLNQNYKALSSYITKTYDANPKLRDKLKLKIKTSQLTWLNLRDANCEIESFTIETGTQAFETTKNNCTARENEERSTYLLYLKDHIL